MLFPAPYKIRVKNIPSFLQQPGFFSTKHDKISPVLTLKNHIKNAFAMIALAPHLAVLFLCIAQANAFTNPVLSSKYAAKSALRMSEGPPYAGPLSKPLLDSVEFPHDMKDFSIKDLKQVCGITSLFTHYITSHLYTHSLLLALVPYLIYIYNLTPFPFPYIALIVLAFE
jgi:hypothetical protein